MKQSSIRPSSKRSNGLADLIDPIDVISQPKNKKFKPQHEFKSILNQKYLNNIEQARMANHQVMIRTKKENKKEGKTEDIVEFK